MTGGSITFQVANGDTYDRMKTASGIGLDIQGWGAAMKEAFL
jgi:hypothetical protein